MEEIVGVGGLILFLGGLILLAEPIFEVGVVAKLVPGNNFLVKGLVGRFH